MGLGYTGMQAFALLTRFNPSYERVLTVGRQHHFTNYPEVKELWNEFGLALDDGKVEAAVKDSPFSESLLQALGCVQVQSIDASHYEQASIIADLNEPVPFELNERFSIVIESGTVEHLFNQRMAFENIFRMIKPNGQLLLITPCNGFCGHGFFQLSPELLFSLCAANDFAVELAYLVPGNVKSDKIFLCPTPASVRGRVEIGWSGPMYFVLVARKTRSIENLKQPLQWDYEQVFWKGEKLSSGTLLVEDIFEQLNVAVDGADEKLPTVQPPREAGTFPILTTGRKFAAKVLRKMSTMMEPKRAAPPFDASTWFYSTQPFPAVAPSRIRGSKEPSRNAAR